MPSRPAPSLAEQIAAAQDWWREAGVDLGFADTPQGWLAEPQVEEQAARPSSIVTAAPQEPKRPKMGGDPASWPQDLATFRQWWLEESSLDHGGTHPRITSRGPQGAPLAVLVPMPEAQDSEVLLSGPQGRLVASMLQAMGFDPQAIFIASALPRHMAMPDWAGLAAEGFGAVVLHQLALASPERLIVLGRDVSPLLGHDPAQSPPPFSEIAIQARKLPAMMGYSPVRLLEQPRLRKAVWQQWLEWSEGDMR